MFGYIQSMGKPMKMERVLIKQCCMTAFIRKCSKSITFGPYQGEINWRPLSFQGSQDANYLHLPPCAKGVPAILRALACTSYPSVFVGK